jgi:type VI secretion system protein ImpA
MDAVEKAVRETPPAFFVALLADLDEASAELSALGKALDQRCGVDAPSTSAIADALGTARDLVREIARAVLPAAAPAAAAAPSEEAAASAETGASGSERPQRTSPVLQDEVHSRDDAFRLLGLVAEYFRQHEPHTPIPFLLERATRWGRLPLPDLLAELIPNDAARATVNQLTGLEFPKPAK